MFTQLFTRPVSPVYPKKPSQTLFMPTLWSGEPAHVFIQQTLSVSYVQALLDTGNVASNKTEMVPSSFMELTV